MMYNKKQRESMKEFGKILMIPVVLMLSPVLIVMALCGMSGSGIFGNFFNDL